MAEKVVSFHKFAVIMNSLQSHDLTNFGPNRQMFKRNDHKIGPGKNLEKKTLINRSI